MSGLDFPWQSCNSLPQILPQYCCFFTYDNPVALLLKHERNKTLRYETYKAISSLIYP